MSMITGRWQSPGKLQVAVPELRTEPKPILLLSVWCAEAGLLLTITTAQSAVTPAGDHQQYTYIIIHTYILILELSSGEASPETTRVCEETSRVRSPASPGPTARSAGLTGVWRWG